MLICIVFNIFQNYIKFQLITLVKKYFSSSNCLVVLSIVFDTDFKYQTLITYTSNVTYTCNYDITFGAEFRSSHRKTLVLESLFYKVASIQTCNVIKKDNPTQVFPGEI